MSSQEDYLDSLLNQMEHPSNLTAKVSLDEALELAQKEATQDELMQETIINAAPEESIMEDDSADKTIIKEIIPEEIGELSSAEGTIPEEMGELSSVEGIIPEEMGGFSSAEEIAQNAEEGIRLDDLGDMSLESVLEFVNTNMENPIPDEEEPVVLKDNSDLNINRDADVLPDVSMESDMLSDINVESDELPDVSMESDVLSDINVESDVLPDVSMESGMLSDINVESDVLPDVSMESDVLSDINVESDELPDVSMESDMLSDINVESDVLPDVSMESDVLSDINTESDVLSDVSMESDMLSDINMESDLLSDINPDTNFDMDMNPVGDIGVDLDSEAGPETTVNPSEEMESELISDVALEADFDFDASEGEQMNPEASENTEGNVDLSDLAQSLEEELNMLTSNTVEEELTAGLDAISEKESIAVDDISDLSAEDIDYLLSGAQKEDDTSLDMPRESSEELVDLLGQSGNEDELEINDLLGKSDSNEMIDDLLSQEDSAAELDMLLGSEEPEKNSKGKKTKEKKKKEKGEKKKLFGRKKKKDEVVLTEEPQTVEYDDIDRLLAEEEDISLNDSLNLAESDTVATEPAFTDQSMGISDVLNENTEEVVIETPGEESEMGVLDMDNLFSLGGEEDSTIETEGSGEAEDVQQIEGLEDDFLNDLLNGVSDEQEVIREKEPSQKPEKKKKKGFFARILDALTDEDEEVSEEEEIILSDENGEILREIDKEKEKGKKKKDKKKKGKEAAEKESEDGEETEAKPEKKKKEKKPKKEKQPKLKAVDDSPKKKLSKRRVILIFLICMSLCGVMLLLINVGGDFAAKNTAVRAFQEKDYETCYENLKGKHLSESQQVMFGQSESILRIRLWVREYEFFVSVEDQERALDCLLLSVRDYPKLYSFSDNYGAGNEVAVIYAHILSLLQSQYHLTQEDAQEIVDVSEDVIYTKIVRAIAAGEPYRYLLEGESAPTVEGVMEDILPEEEELLPIE